MSGNELRTHAAEDFKSHEEKYYLASQWQLMMRKLRRHKLALLGLILLAVLYGVCLTAGFFSPYLLNEQNLKMLNAPPQRPRFVDGGKIYIRPFVYGLTQ